MSSAWITFGPAKFFSCSRWSRKQTSAGNSTHVRSSQLWSNTLDQVFYIDYLGYLANLLQSGYLVYLGLLMLLLGSLVGQMQLHHYLRTPLAIANYVCHTHLRTFQLTMTTMTTMKNFHCYIVKRIVNYCMYCIWHCFNHLCIVQSIVCIVIIALYCNLVYIVCFCK
jgi:hypothetical protein